MIIQKIPLATGENKLDGRHIAILSQEGRKWEVYVRPALRRHGDPGNIAAFHGEYEECCTFVAGWLAGRAPVEASKPETLAVGGPPPEAFKIEASVTATKREDGTLEVAIETGRALPQAVLIELMALGKTLVDLPPTIAIGLLWQISDRLNAVWRDQIDHQDGLAEVGLPRTLKLYRWMAEGCKGSLNAVVGLIRYFETQAFPLPEPPELTMKAEAFVKRYTWSPAEESEKK